MHDLIRRLDPHLALRDLSDALGSSLSFDFAGVATMAEDGGRFEVIGATRRTRDIDKPTRGSFPRAGTVGGWSLMTGIPFVSERVRNVEKFPQTYTDMRRYGMSSNAVIPLQTGEERPAILYFLSRRSDDRWLDQVGLFARLRSVLEPTVTAFLAARRLVDGAVESEPCPEVAPEADASLAAMERLLIERTLEDRNWVVEGPRGAAAKLGLKPSTLRSRMRKFGLHRPAT